MNKEHLIQISGSKPEVLRAPKFWSIMASDEEESEMQLTGKEITFRGNRWKVDMVAQQTSIPGRVAGVKLHPELTKAELIATMWGPQRVRTMHAEVIGRDEMRGPLTKDEFGQSEVFFVEEQHCDPWMKIVHPTKGVFRQEFSIVMPGGSHQAAYGTDTGCIAIKLSLLD